MGIIYNSLTPSEGLVLSLDTANRRSYPGSGNTWFDLSGNNNHGTLTNGASLNTGPGGGMNFDGVNDYVAATRFPPTGQQAYSFWIKTTAINQSVVGFSDKLSPDGSSAYDRDFQIDSSGRLQFRMFDVTGSVSIYKSKN